MACYYIQLLHLWLHLETRKCNNPRKCNNFSHFVIVTTNWSKLTTFGVSQLLGSISVQKCSKFNIDQKVVILTTHHETARKWPISVFCGSQGPFLCKYVTTFVQVKTLFMYGKLLHLELLHLWLHLETRKCNNPRKCNNFSH